MSSTATLESLFSSIFGVDDPRKAGLRRGLCQLTNDQIVQALAVPNVVVDTWNYHEGNFCPLACGVGLHRTMTDPTHEKVLDDLERRGFKVNNTRGIKGTFYTTDRDADWRLLGHEIILARGKRRLVPVIVPVHMPSKRVLMLQRRHDSKYPNQWCIPGGKIEPGESVAECVHREFQCKTVEKEPIKVWDAAEIIGERNLMHNMRWMIPFLQDYDMIPHDLGTLRIHR